MECSVSFLMRLATNDVHFSSALRNDGHYVAQSSRAALAKCVLAPVPGLCAFAKASRCAVLGFPSDKDF
jgi:uncharacterized protein with von Willebrand factor type A (vWA) domain